MSPNWVQIEILLILAKIKDCVQIGEFSFSTKCISAKIGEKTRQSRYMNLQRVRIRNEIFIYHNLLTQSFMQNRLNLKCRSGLKLKLETRCELSYPQWKYFPVHWL